MTTGTVSLSLADVDQLRDSIKNGETKIKELEGLLAEVKADKRVMKVTNNSCKINPRDLPYSIDVQKLEWLMRNGRSGNKFELIKECVTFLPMNIKDQEPKTEYVNFEDVKGQIREELDKQYNEEIGELRQKEKQQIQKIAELKAQFEEEGVQEQQLFEKERKQFREAIAEWEKKYTDLRDDRDTRTEIQKLEDKINEYKELLIQEQKKSWFQKLLGK